MFARIVAIAINSYREAVRARVLYGLLALALGTGAYSLVVASLSLRQETRVVADLGAASISFYAVLVAIVLGATSLYREVELKTVFPILTRRLHRHEYLLGKYFGTLLTLAVFVAIDAAAVLAVLAIQAGRGALTVGLVVGGLLAVLGALLVRAKYTRVFVTIPWAFAALTTLAWVAEPAGPERQVVLASAALTMGEVAIVAAIAVFFSSFSSPFLTATFTIGVFLVGRSADTLANLPARVFGETMRRVGQSLAAVFPNLHLYVPARALLRGELTDISTWKYVLESSVHAAFYATITLALSALVFRKRDFQ